MSLHAVLRVGARTVIGGIEITRTTNLDDVALRPDVVSSYAVAVDGQLVGHVDHRYGAGAWALLQAAAQLAAGQNPHAPTTAAAELWLLDVFVAGRPAPQGSKMARPIYRGRGQDREFTGKVAQVESSKSGVNEWRADVRAACTSAWSGREQLDGPLVLDVEFVRKRPAGAPKRSTPPATTAPDLSKLIRSTEDAITSSGLWADDARVVELHAHKRLAEIGETPGARIRVRAWTAEARP